MEVFTAFSNETLILLGALIVILGGSAGTLAGLLGIGGGLVIVPGLYFIFTTLAMPSEHLMHVCIGTALANIIFTGTSSARSHWKRGSLDFQLLKSIGVGMVLGTGIGTALAAVLDGQALLGFFATVLIVLAALMALNPVSKSSPSLHGKPLFFGSGGTVIGTICTLMGIGGGALTVPFMMFLGVPIHRAVGTASALGVMVAFPAMLGFVFIGWGMPDRPPFSVGFVNVMAFCILLPMTVLFAPLGARLAHALPVQRLRLVFAIFLVFISAKMWMDFLG